MYTNTAYKRECNSLYRGVVEDNVDPQGLGRCRVRVPSVYGELTYPTEMIPWARPMTTSPIGSSRGSVNIPTIGDIVWVMFEGSNRNYPVYFGGTYAKGEVAINNDVVDFYLENDDKISYHRKDRVYTIKLGDTIIKVTPDDVDIYAPKRININAGESITLKAPRIDLNP